MKLTGEQVESLFREEYLDGFDILEQTEWTQDHKYQFSDIIIQSNFDGKIYLVNISRSGSYHSDWYYCFEGTKEYECPEVEKVEIKSYIWKVKK